MNSMFYQYKLDFLHLHLSFLCQVVVVVGLPVLQLHRSELLVSDPPS